MSNMPMRQSDFESKSIDLLKLALQMRYIGNDMVEDSNCSMNKVSEEYRNAARYLVSAANQVSKFASNIVPSVE